MAEYNNSIGTDKFFEPGKRTWAIFFISVSGLFLELLLIRWIGTEVRIFAYLQNTVLVACFLGLGLGCFTSRQPIVLKNSLVPLGLILIILTIPVSRHLVGLISSLLSATGDFLIWEAMEPENLFLSIILVFTGLLLTYVLLIIIVDIFVPFGRLLARLMDEHPNTIWAYSVNIAGSLVGTWLFVLLSYFYQPPFTWFCLFGALMLIFIIWQQRDKKMNFALLLIIIALSWFAGQVPNALSVTWSPYQKLAVEKSRADDEFRSVGEYFVAVNNTGYQMIGDLSQSFMEANPDKFPEDIRGLSQYDIPLLLHPDPHSFLIVGAGCGNDAAGGLRHAVQNIVAVEIDPAIIEIGQELHPEKPYSSPNVEIVNDDARSYFATTDKKFDVIAFGLLDSHTTTAMTNARLDHYVYTKESIARAKTLLAEGGIMVLTFEAQKPFIADRMDRVLEETFGEKPISFVIPFSYNGWGGAMFIAGDLETAKAEIKNNPRLAAYINQLQKEEPLVLSHTTKVTTDDWPYTYLEQPSIPVLYYLLTGLFILIFIRSNIKWKGANIFTRWSRPHWHFFFLGAAFLLLEVQNISKASVVLGNTWETNAIIISGVLVMALLANWLAYTFPKLPMGFSYVGVIGISLALYFIDLAEFAFLPFTLKALVVGGLTTLPMLFSGIIFIRSFANSDAKDEAFGANFAGSLTGALFQSITFILGIKTLLLIVAGFYFLSLLSRPNRSPSAAVQVN
ncbi:MAG: hypothetical protein JXA13_14200 [Anaerolineales bacterium]|nr:hypothetical protein [Anaerolineales bacterium]